MKYQFCIRFDTIDANSAASKAVTDCNTLFSKHGYQDYTFTVPNNKRKLRYYYQLAKELGRFFFHIKPRAIVAIQYPLLSINQVFKYFIWWAKLKKVSFFCIIHDLEALRSGKNDALAIQKEIQTLNNYQAVIAHNEHMVAWLKESGLRSQVISLGLFDYLIGDFEVKASSVADDIVFAGNLAKSTFTKRLAKIEGKFKLYGPNFNLGDSQKNVRWMGQYSPVQIASELNGSFGLIWDGGELDHLDSVFGNYLKYNHPHKCSLYIAAGLPLIVPQSAAIHKLVSDFEIGITINSLHELTNINVSESAYQRMKANVSKLRQRLINGVQFSTAIKKIEEILK